MILNIIDRLVHTLVFNGNMYATTDNHENKVFKIFS